MHPLALALLTALLALVPGPAALSAAALGAAPPATAAELGLMSGSPPPADKIVTIENFLFPPYNRWGLQHVRELVPTRAVPASGTPAALGQRPADIGAITVALAADRSVSVGDWLETAYTDGFLVLHQGEVAFERYYNGQDPATQHLVFSVTKSLTGTLMLMLMEQGRVDGQQTVAHYLPELAGSAFADATVEQMLDMTNSIDYNEDYTDVEGDIAQFLGAMMPGGEGLYPYLQGLKKPHPVFGHGEAFHYVTPVPEVLGWVIRRVTGDNLAEVLHRMIWAPLGAEHEAWYWLDFYGVEMAGGGLAITLRDAARFGQMILQDGRSNGQQVISAAIAQRIKSPRNHDKFNHTAPRYHGVRASYHDQWWGYAGVNAVAAIGIHGQFIYISPDHDVVIVKHTSDPHAGGDRVNTETAKVMHAIAAWLGEQRQ